MAENIAAWLLDNSVKRGDNQVLRKRLSLKGETRLLPTTIVTTYKYHQTICNFGKWQKSIISFENGFK